MNKRSPFVSAMPYILGSLGLLSSQILIAESVPISLEEKVIIKQVTVIKEVPVICTTTATQAEPCIAEGALKFVGGQTRLSIGLDSDLKSRAGISHVFSDSDNHASGAEAWVGLDVTAEANQDEEHLTGAGIKFNHHWVSKNKQGNASHVNKVFVAVDQNKQRSRKASAGYGQETKNLFWSSYASKGFTEKFWDAHDEEDNDVYALTYEYGVGAKVGKMFESQLVRLRGGIDYEWGTVKCLNTLIMKLKPNKSVHRLELKSSSKTHLIVSPPMPATLIRQGVNCHLNNQAYAAILTTVMMWGQMCFVPMKNIGVSA